MTVEGAIVALDAGDMVAAVDLLARRVRRGEADECSALELRAAAARLRLAGRRAQLLAGELDRKAREAPA